MASSRGTLNSPDWKDVAEALKSFEDMDGLEIQVTLRSCVTGKTKDIRIVAEAWPIGGLLTGARPSGSVSATCLATNRLTLDAAVLAMLYQLDFKLALREYGEEPTK